MFPWEESDRMVFCGSGSILSPLQSSVSLFVCINVCVRARACISHKQLLLQCLDLCLLSNACILYFANNVNPEPFKKKKKKRAKCWNESDVGSSVQIFLLTSLRFLHTDASKTAQQNPKNVIQCNKTVNWLQGVNWGVLKGNGLC